MANLIPEERVCQELEVEQATLEAWLALGLIERTNMGAVVGYTPSQVRRIWSIRSLAEDLEVNLEGVRIILDMSEQLRELQTALLHAQRRFDQVRRVDAFRLRVIEDHLGGNRWEIDV